MGTTPPWPVGALRPSRARGDHRQHRRLALDHQEAVAGRGRLVEDEEVVARVGVGPLLRVVPAAAAAGVRVWQRCDDVIAGRYPMTRFVVDASAVLHLANAGIEVPGEHELLAPTLLRSQTLSALYEAAQRREIPADVARDRLARIGRMPIRLLGDAVLRRRA